MRLGGFVIHGNNVGTLGDCLDSLKAVADELVAVDSGSTDGSAELVRARGIRAVRHPWEGFGSARARAARELSGCDFLFFIDADERLSAESLPVLKAFKAQTPPKARYRVAIRDWAELPAARFVFRRERHVRLVRADCATWEPRMIVHEALSRGDADVLEGVTIEHRFVTSLETRRDKENTYAWLWAVRAFVEGRRSKLPALQRPAHTFRNAIVKGALFRGGATALQLAWTVSRYHEMKYRYLQEIESGQYAEAVAALRENRLSDVFRLAPGASPG